MAQKPWERNWSQQSGSARIYGNPKPGEEVDLRRDEVGLRRDMIGAQLDERRLQTAPYDARKAEADAERAAYERDKAAREAAAQGTPKGRFEDMESFGKRFAGEQAVKNYQDTVPQYAAALRVDDTKAGDLSLIYSFGKIMDPGSVVREGEMVMVQGTGTVQDRLKGLMSELDGSGRLSERSRRALQMELRNKGSAIADAYNSVRADYKNRASAYGMDPELVLGSHPGLPFQQAEADFLGRPIRNLDGSQGAAPRAPSAQGGEGSVEPEGPKLSDRQIAAYDAWLSAQTPGKLTSGQLSAFFKSLTGREIDNAQDVVAAFNGGAGFQSATKAQYRNLDAEQIKEQVDKADGRAGLTDLVLQGATLGLSDEAAGVGGALANVVMSPFTDTPFDPLAAYQANKSAELMRLDDARNDLGGWATPVEIGSGLLSGNPSSALAAAPTLMGRMTQGAKAGAAGGAIGGFGTGEGTQQSLTNAAVYGTGGALLGGAIPAAGQVISNRAGGLQRLLGNDPELPRRLVSESLGADANTPRAVGQMLDQARERGSPMMLADTGENARSLLASVGRQPGPSRNITRNAVIERQKAQTERISEAVVRDLGPTANIREMGEELIGRARASAAPLYDQAYSAPGASSLKLDDLMTRPAFQRALKNAQQLAAEEGVDPTTLGFQFNPAGDVVLERVPSWQTLDYVKRGLDDVVEAFRDGTSGKLNLNTGAARATESTRRALLSRMDAANPTYKAAREAYAGPAKMRDALEKGARALNRSPDDIMAMMKGMGDAEKESFRLGVRKGIVDLLASQRDGGDKVARLVGTPKSRAVLSHVFGGKAEFDRFIATLRDEEAMGQTYRAIASGSPTAERMAADATVNDTGLAESAMDAALRGGKDGAWSALVAGVQKLREVDRFGAGAAGERTRESVAALLTETDPAVLTELVSAGRKALARQRALAGQWTRNAVTGGRNAGQITGYGLGGMNEQRPEPR